MKILNSLPVFSGENTPRQAVYNATVDSAGKIIAANVVAVTAAETARAKELTTSATLILAAAAEKLARDAETAARLANEETPSAANQAALDAAARRAEEAIQTQLAALAAANAAADEAERVANQARLDSIAAADELRKAIEAEKIAQAEREAEEEAEQDAREQAIASAQARIEAGITERINARNARASATQSRAQLNILLSQRTSLPAAIARGTELVASLSRRLRALQFLSVPFGPDGRGGRARRVLTPAEQVEVDLIKSQISYGLAGLVSARKTLAELEPKIRQKTQSTQALESTAARLEGVADAAEKALLDAALAIPET